MKQIKNIYRQILICILLIAPLTCTAQSIINGTVNNVKGTPIEYVNVH
jgi:hypothetical protein